MVYELCRRKWARCMMLMRIGTIMIYAAMIIVFIYSLLVHNNYILGGSFVVFLGLLYVLYKGDDFCDENFKECMGD